MSKLKLNAIATQALIDREFERAILNGHRKERLQEFDLTQEEIDVLMSIDAHTLDQFIHRLRSLMVNPAWAY